MRKKDNRKDLSRMAAPRVLGRWMRTSNYRFSALGESSRKARNKLFSAGTVRISSRMFAGNRIGEKKRYQKEEGGDKSRGCGAESKKKQKKKN